jgi:hypothetical protein
MLIEMMRQIEMSNMLIEKERKNNNNKIVKIRLLQRRDNAAYE